MRVLLHIFTEKCTLLAFMMAIIINRLHVTIARTCTLHFFCNLLTIKAYFNNFSLNIPHEYIIKRKYDHDIVQCWQSMSVYEHVNITSLIKTTKSAGASSPSWHAKTALISLTFHLNYLILIEVFSQTTRHCFVSLECVSLLSPKPWKNRTQRKYHTRIHSCVLKLFFLTQNVKV